MHAVIQFLERQPPRRLFVASALLLALIVWVDAITAYDLTLTAAYLLPVLLVAWAGNKRAGVVIATSASVAWGAADLLSGHHFGRPFFFFWAIAVRFASFTIFVLMLSELKRALARERALARTDALTGLGNRMAFYEKLAEEIDRSRRYARDFSVAYLDCDNFKEVNDTWGHETGDALLRSIGNTLRKELRSSDFAGRLGGDEFGVVLPEATADAAASAVQLVRCRLLETMQKGGWPVTFSIGICSYRAPTGDANSVLREVDALMYEAKRAGKNSTRQQNGSSGTHA